MNKLNNRYIIKFILIINIITPCLFAQSWTVDNSNGWVYHDSEKFFAIGIWNIPVFDGGAGSLSKNWNSLPDDEQESSFIAASDIFNIITISSVDPRPSWMNAATLLTGSSVFKAEMQLELDKIGGNDNGIIEFNEMKELQNNISSYNSRYEHIVQRILNNNTNSGDFLWYLKGEPDVSHYEWWYWHPEILEKYKSTIINTSSSNPKITYIDLFGTLAGTNYLYERSYEEYYTLPLRSLPTTGPFGGDLDSLKTYKYAYTGNSAKTLPRYTWDNSTLKWEDRFIYNQDLYYDDPDFDIFSNNFYESAKGYRDAADIIGLNSYCEFRDHPILAGISVDKLKEGCRPDYPDKPVWLFFDGAAFNKSSYPFDDYYKRIRCQVYTSIAHGATGVLFWTENGWIDTLGNPHGTPYEHWINIRELAQELKNYNDILVGDLESMDKFGHHVHYIKNRNNSKKIQSLIITNSSIDDYATSLSVSEFEQEIDLAPLEVVILLNFINNHTVSDLRIYEGFHSITTKQQYIINDGAEVTFTASNEIKLKPGFEARIGSEFAANIENTNGSMPKIVPPDKNGKNNEINNDVPSDFFLTQNYPNPFNPTTTINYTLKQSNKVLIEIYNALGQRIDVILDKSMPSGSHYIKFDGRDLPSGIYYYRITTKDFQQVKKMLLIN